MQKLLIKANILSLSSFEKGLKNFNQIHLKNYNYKFTKLSLRNYSKKLDEFLKRINTDIIIFDSYCINLKLEKKLYDKFFLISFDDKISKHNSHCI